MSRFPGRPVAVWCWVLLPLVVMAHLTLAVLAAAEFAVMGWPLPTWFDTDAVTLVLATAAVGLAASALVTLRTVAGARALRALIRAAGRRSRLCCGTKRPRWAWPPGWMWSRARTLSPSPPA